MECPRCHHTIIQGVLFCPHCEAPLKIFLEEANPMGTTVWEYGKTEGEEQGSNHQLDPQHEHTQPSMPVRRKP